MRRTLLVLLFFISILVASEGYERKRVTIPDDLDDVVDDEDDDAWEQWGLKKSGSGPDKNLPPPNFSKMDPSKIQELMKQHTGPSYGFVKLRFGVSRSKVDVQNIATKWSKMLKTGSIDVRFMATDLNTFMFTMEKGQDLEELKEFILSQSDAYEVKIGDQTYRRPGDPPLDQVIERLCREKHSSAAAAAAAAAVFSLDDLYGDEDGWEPASSHRPQYMEPRQHDGEASGSGAQTADGFASAIFGTPPPATYPPTWEADPWVLRTQAGIHGEHALHLGADPWAREAVHDDMQVDEVHQRRPPSQRERRAPERLDLSGPRPRHRR